MVTLSNMAGSCYTLINLSLVLILINSNNQLLTNAIPQSYTSTPITITRYSDNLNENSNHDPLAGITTKNEYFKLRDEFLRDESKRYLGSDMELNENELKLNKIFMKLKQQEFEDGFKDPFKFKASRHFFEVVHAINNSDLFKLIEKMPKGSVLHAHDTAMASIDFVINNVLNNEKYYNILWYCDNTTTTILPHETNPLDIDNEQTLFTSALPNGTKTIVQIEINKIQFLFSRVKPTKLDNFNDWKLLNDLRKHLEPEKLTKILYKHLTLFTKNPSIDFKDINDVWSKFANIFVTLNGVVLYEPVWRDYFYQALKEFYEDNVQYIEFRGLLPKLYDLDGTEYTQLDTLNIYNETLKQFKTDYPDFVGAKFIYGPNRRVNNDTFDKYMNSVEEFKAKYPNLVAGFDLVAQEDLGNPLKDYVESLLNLHNKHSDIEFFFHAGETNWNGMDTDENLIDAVLLGAKRIGHGYAILKHPKVMEEIKKRDIAIEINPISNQVLKLVNDNRNHPAAHLLADNYPVVISSDDPSFWGAKPLSHDFYIAFMGLASAHADLRLFKQLALNSIKYSSLKGYEYYSAETFWEATWYKYVDDMLLEYSHLM